MARENMEDQIFSTLSDAGETFDDDTSTDNGDVDSTDAGGSSTEPNQQLVNDGVIPQQPTQQAPVQQPRRDLASQPKDGLVKVNPKDPNSPFRDQQGNLVDAQGNLIASRGAERRIAAQTERLKSVNTDLQNRITEQQREIQQLQQINQLPQQLGLDRNDVNEALQTAALFARDPIAGARKAIEIALARGANLQQIMNDEFVPNVSLDATRRLLDERLGPISQKNQQEETQARVERQARQEANQFLADNPEAETHLQDVAAVTSEIKARFAAAGRSIDNMAAAEMALQQIKTFVIEKGLDINRPIREQIEELAGGRASGQSASTPGQVRAGPNVAQRSTPPRQQVRPMPNGSRGSGVPEVRPSVAAPNESIDSIIRASMREAGINY